MDIKIAVRCIDKLPTDKQWSIPLLGITPQGVERLVTYVGNGVWEEYDDGVVVDIVEWYDTVDIEPTVLPSVELFPMEERVSFKDKQWGKTGNETILITARVIESYHKALTLAEHELRGRVSMLAYTDKLHKELRAKSKADLKRISESFKFKKPKCKPKTLYTYLDKDGNSCVKVMDVLVMYPLIDVLCIYTTYGSSGFDDYFKPLQLDDVLTYSMKLKDLEPFIVLYKAICKKLGVKILGMKPIEFNLCEVHICNVCGEAILPNEDAYTDIVSGLVLCGKHTKFVEELQGHAAISLKHPNLSMFTDAGGVLCAIVSDVLSEYPYIDELTIDYSGCNGRTFSSFCWDIQHKTDTTKDYEVMAVADLQLFINMYIDVCKRLGVDKLGAGVEHKDIGTCSICGVILLPDDELYTDSKTNATLCDAHSMYNDITGMYEATQEA